jgi:hypothetical protein
MRTVKLTIEHPGPHDRAPTLTFSTEVIIDDDADPRDAGNEAGKFLVAFSEGVGNSGNSD